VSFRSLLVWLIPFLSLCASQSLAEISRPQSEANPPSAPSPGHNTTANDIDLKQPGQATTVGVGKVVDGHQLLNMDSYLETQPSGAAKLQTLHTERLWVTDRLRTLDETLARLERQQGEKPLPVPTISETEYRVMITDLDTKIDDNERVAHDARSPELDRERAQVELLRLVRQKGTLDATYAKSQSYRADLVRYQEINESLRTINEEIPDLNRYLVSIDDNASNLLAASHLENEFKLTITIAFSILIAVVIIGFFAIAYRERGVRDALFASDSGLQFVALFSLIIAIVLFGVINILEGRELAALLGGLSGYILGRGNLGQGREPKDRPSDRPPSGFD
jgi:hypothetical protein